MKEEGDLSADLRAHCCILTWPFQLPFQLLAHLLMWDEAGRSEARGDYLKAWTGLLVDDVLGYETKKKQAVMKNY